MNEIMITLTLTLPQSQAQQVLRYLNGTPQQRYYQKTRSQATTDPKAKTNPVV